MKSPGPFFRKEELRSPAALLFAGVYVFAVVIGLLTSAQQTFIYIGLSFGIALLIWLIIGLTDHL
ncbi:MAG: hypothetical protein ACE5IW_03605 [bacterium]